MPSTAEKLKNDPEHRSIVEGALKESLGDTSYHENFVEGVKSVTDSKEAVLEAERKATQVRERLEKEYQKNTLVDDSKTLQRAFKEAHLTEDDFKNIPEWNSSTPEQEKLTPEQKKLIVQLASQDTLANVKKLGQERFEEKNKISFSGEQRDSVSSASKKVWNKMWKSISISKEEKTVLRDVEHGRIKPKEETLRQLVKRVGKLPVTEKNGKVFVSFLNENKNTPETERAVIERYNKIANEFSKMPDEWRNEEAARSKDDRTFFKKENYAKYHAIKKQYEEIRQTAVDAQEKIYKAQGDTDVVARKKALSDMRKADSTVYGLQFDTTNPDALVELDRVRNESSYGRFFNNENRWKIIYGGIGFGMRWGAVPALGLIAAPAVSAVIGGWRARRKANQKIEDAFSQGRKQETLKERKLTGKEGLYDDKNANLSFLQKAGKLASGFDVNTKEVASFVDADQLIQRLDNFVKRIEKADNKIEEDKIRRELQSRIDYIDKKHREGLINYGSQNPAGLNYDLLTKLSEASLQTIPDLNVAPENETDQERDARKALIVRSTEQEKLLKKLMEQNQQRFDAKQTKFKTDELKRGIKIGATFAIAGALTREWFSLTPDHIETNLDEKFSPQDNTYVTPPLVQDTEGLRPAGDGPYPFPKNEIPPISGEAISHKPIEVQLSSKGSIQTFLDLKEKLRLEYGKDLAHAPVSVQHIMNTNAIKLAEEFNMYNPTDVDESMMAPAGSKFIIDEKGNFSYQELGAKDASILEEGTSAKGTTEYKGKMFDYDKAKTLKVETAQNVGTSTPETPQTNTANIPSRTEITQNISQTNETIIETPVTTPGSGLHEDFNKVFPPDEKINGEAPRGTFNSFVYKTFENEWKSLPKADRDAELWLYEKFGAVTVNKNGNEILLSKLVSPKDYLGFDLKTTTLANAIKLNSEVGKNISQLQNIVFEQTGQNIEPGANESVTDYTHRLFKTLEGTAGEQPGKTPLQEEFSPMGSATGGRKLPGDYMAEQSEQQFNTQEQNGMRIINASNTTEAPDGGTEPMEPKNGIKGAPTTYTETVTKPSIEHPIDWEKYRDHKILTADDIRGRNEIIGKSPIVNDRNITYRDWNRVFDNSVLKTQNIKFGSYGEYETERELQLLFGHAEQKLEYDEALKRSVLTTDMDYFRERPEWASISKIPARYFYNEFFSDEYLAHKGEISREDLKIIGQSGLLKQIPVELANGQKVMALKFIHQGELMRLVEAYKHINPKDAQPYPSESIEEYVGRLTKKVHQAQDGTFFARKHDVHSHIAGGNRPSMGPQTPQPVYTPSTPGVISPTRGIYNTGGTPTVSPTQGVYNDGSMFGPSGSNYGSPYGQQGYGYAPGFNTGSRQGDVIVGGAQVAQTAINEGLAVATGNASGGGGKRILNSAVQNGVQIGVNEIMRQIFGGRGGGYYGGGSNWQ